MARILLAEDDAATRDLVQRALGLDGHEVVVTQDGMEALEKLQAAPARVDLLITDVQMPVLDGIALAEKALARQSEAAHRADVGLCRRTRPCRPPQGQDRPRHHQAVHAGADSLGGAGSARLAAI